MSLLSQRIFTNFYRRAQKECDVASLSFTPLFQPLVTFMLVPLIRLIRPAYVVELTKNVTKFSRTSWHECQQRFCGLFAARRTLFFLCVFDHPRPFDNYMSDKILEYSSGIPRFVKLRLKYSLLFDVVL